ncbi:MAG: hypothetical protein ACO1SX_23490 [Actinomycetota bacterium]
MKPGTEIHAAFAREAQAQGVEVRAIQANGRVVVALGDQELTVSLENISRDLARDGDPDALRHFVSKIRGSIVELPPWSEAQSGLRFSVEAANHDFGDAIHEPVTGEIARVLVYVDPEESQIRCLTPADLKEWGIDMPEAKRAAAAGMSALLDQTKLEVAPVQSHSLGYLDTDSPLKASLIFSPSLKAKVTPALGWPVYAVIPARDFVYLFPKRDAALIERISSVVVKEYRESGYPITTEVLEISDAGIKAIGKFADKG